MDGAPINFRDEPEALVTIKGRVYPVVYSVTRSEDFDHGQRVFWRRVDPGIMDGVVKPRFLNLMELRDSELLFSVRPNIPKMKIVKVGTITENNQARDWTFSGEGLEGVEAIYDRDGWNLVGGYTADELRLVAGTGKL